MSIKADPKDFFSYVMEGYKSVNVTDNLRSKYTSFYNNTRINQFCGNDYLAGPFNQIKPRNTYIEVDACQKSTGHVTFSSTNLISFMFLAFSILANLTEKYF